MTHQTSAARSIRLFSLLTAASLAVAGSARAQESYPPSPSSPEPYAPRATAIAPRSPATGQPPAPLGRPPPRVDPPVVLRVGGPYLLAGTDFDAVLADPIGGEHGRPGAPFAARVERDLRAPTGEVVVPAGAIIRGRVPEQIADFRAGIPIRLDTVDTVRGKSPIHATIQLASGYASPRMPPALLGRERPEYDAVLRPPAINAIGGGPPEPPESAPGAGPAPPAHSDPSRETPVRVPSGAGLRVVLLDALVPPGVPVRQERVVPFDRPRSDFVRAILQP